MYRSMATTQRKWWLMILNNVLAEGHPDGSVGLASDSRFRLKSWSHSWWDRAPCRTLCWQCSVCLGLSFSLSLCPLPAHTLSFSRENKQTTKKWSIGRKAHRYTSCSTSPYASNICIRINSAFFFLAQRETAEKETKGKQIPWRKEWLFKCVSYLTGRCLCILSLKITDVCVSASKDIGDSFSEIICSPFLKVYSNSIFHLKA